MPAPLLDGVLVVAPSEDVQEMAPSEDVLKVAPSEDVPPEGE